jgi:two-component system heavy metal sensor histidine kinase CusS
MRRLSLTAKLSGAFALVTLLTSYLVGNQLYNSLSRQLLGNVDELLVHKAQRLRDLVAEEASAAELQNRVTRFQGQLAASDGFVVQIRSSDDRVLIEFNPSSLPVVATTVIPDGEPVRETSLQRWPGPTAPIRGVAFEAHLGGGAPVTVIVGRTLQDVLAPLEQFRRKLILSLLLGAVAAIALSYIVVRGALRPLLRMTREAGRITMERLSTRLDEANTSPELRSLSVSLNRMLARLERRFQALSTYTDNLAHDLRTPLNNLRGQTEVMLSRTRTVEEYQALLASNLEEFERLGRMIEKILFLARTEDPQVALRKTELNLAEQLQQVAEYFEGLAAESGAVLRVQASGTVKADVELFRRAISNLVSNALRYTPRDGVIELSTARAHGGTIVSVSNAGPEIAPEHLERIFERFYRVDPARSGASTGLGLAIVRSIMNAHGGTAAAESRDGVTRFHLHFPD